MDVDVGMEIGPQMGHPHFHAIVSFVHYSYLQVDKYRMEGLLEAMFKGLSHRSDSHPRGQFRLQDGSGNDFYTDNEKPYVQIKAIATDDVQEVYAAYVRKGADKASMMSLRARNGSYFFPRKEQQWTKV